MILKQYAKRAWPTLLALGLSACGGGSGGAVSIAGAAGGISGGSTSGSANTASSAMATACTQVVGPSFVPNDPYLGAQWHLDRITATTAWDLSKGQSVTVAVVDSGVDGQHPDLTANVVVGWNMVDGTRVTDDVFGHGTRGAGVVSASVNNGMGVAGVALQARLMPVRVANIDGNATIGRLLAGIIQAVDAGARVVNVSYAQAATNPMIQEAGRYAHSRGAVLVVAAGNEGRNFSQQPTLGMVVVGGTGQDDRRVSWSDYGPHITVVAPADGIWTTERQGGYRAVSGTSYASPMVAGVLALMMAANPKASIDELVGWLKATSRDVGPAGFDVEHGHGIVDARRAVAMAASQATVSATAASGGSGGAASSGGGAGTWNMTAPSCAPSGAGQPPGG